MRSLKVLTITLLVYCIMHSEGKKIQGLFFPEELQTILNVVYSRLPPVKIGSDKRFGVGFRIGRNADAQILVELGPQSETQPLGGSSSQSKRESRRQKYFQYHRPTENTIAIDNIAPVKTAESIAFSDKTADDKISDNKHSEIRIPDDKISDNEIIDYTVNNEKPIPIRRSELKSFTEKTKTTTIEPSTEKSIKAEIKPFVEKSADSIVHTEKPVYTQTSRGAEPLMNIFMNWLVRLSNQLNEYTDNRRYSYK